MYGLIFKYYLSPLLIFSLHQFKAICSISLKLSNYLVWRSMSLISFKICQLSKKFFTNFEHI